MLDKVYEEGDLFRSLQVHLSCNQQVSMKLFYLHQYSTLDLLNFAPLDLQGEIKLLHAVIMSLHKFFSKLVNSLAVDVSKVDYDTDFSQSGQS